MPEQTPKRDYFFALTLEQRLALAGDLNVSYEYLRRCFIGERKVSGKLARNLEGLTPFNRVDWRPDLFA